MAKINPTPEEQTQIFDAIRNGTEISPDYFPKLFPNMADKFDVKALDRAKIPTLEYAGKRSKAVILAEGGAGLGAELLQIVRCFGKPEGLSAYSRGFTPLDNRYRTGDTMRTHKFFQSHATHYNTISNGVKPPA